MKLIQKIYRFLEPLSDNKLFTFLSCLKFSTWGIYAVASVIIMKASLKSIEHHDIQSYNQNIIIFLTFIGVYFFVSWILRTTDWPGLYHDIERWIYRRYIPKIILLDNNYLESIGTGKMISILRDGRTIWVDQLTKLLMELMKIIITGGFLFYLISQMGYSYILIVILALILMHGIVIYIDTIAHKYRKTRTTEKGELTRKLVRVIMTKNEILQNHLTQRELKNIEDSVNVIDNANNNINKSMYFIFNSVRAFAVILRLGVLLGMGYGVFLGKFSVTDFATILAMVIVFESFLFDSTEFYKNFTKDFSDIEKLWEVIDDGPIMQGYDSGNIFTAQEASIEISNITYGYNETKIFDDFSLSLEKGKKIALVGPSGGGKTTLMKLLAGYLHPENGSISIMGNILSETALKTYYPHVGYLTQEPSVFDATIRENLTSSLVQSVKLENISSSSVSEEKILIEALKLAQCDFVFELEKGLDTEIGERGVRLSGGQKQRLAIAKIFLKNPEIILLDEPTSALDSFSEEKITEALDALFRSRTVVIVAHRLQTVKKADDIIVIEGGKIHERGSHDELVEKRGIYNKMLELQSGF